MPGATNGGTLDADYRWKWLSTVFVGVYGLLFPLWIAVVSVLGGEISVGGLLMGALTIGWLGCVVYAVGPENVETAKSLQDD